MSTQQHNHDANLYYEAAFDKKTSPRIQAQVINLLTAIYQKLCAIETKLP